MTAPRLDVTEPAHTLWLDVEDLFEHAAANLRPSGIQRLGCVTEFCEAQVDQGCGELGEAHPAAACLIAAEGNANIVFQAREPVLDVVAFGVDRLVPRRWIEHAFLGWRVNSATVLGEIILASEVDKPEKHVICRGCGAIDTVSRNTEILDCRCCGSRTEIAKGNVVFGSAICPHCAKPERLTDVSPRTGGPRQFRLFATESLPPVPGLRPVPMADRLFASADAHGAALFGMVQAELQSLLTEGALVLRNASSPRRTDRMTGCAATATSATRTSSTPGNAFTCCFSVPPSTRWSPDWSARRSASRSATT